ncbi:MAG: septal ring lytic transglycosylase RlpA family protein [Chloroflexi bacterium]|nr:septal ring lytic transglycosylase RlpA family protein [Chloroflexota bacterium]
MSLLMAGRPQPAASASALEWELPSGHFFTQANGFPTGSSPKGFSVTDDGGVRFWSEFQRLGGVDSLGYPVSRRFIWDGYVSQAMQKGVLQWRPDQGKALLVNALDQLTAASKDDWLFNVRGTPRPLDSSFDAGKSPSDIVNARLALLDARPAMRDAYFGVDEPLQRYGLPTSRVEDMGTAYVVRLQRAVLQEWKVDTAWARAGQVTVANGGDLAKEAGILPAKAPYPEDPPPGLWKPQAGEYRVSGDATWYGGQFHGRKMANGQTYDMNDVTTVASNMYPLGTKVKITHGTTGASITAVVKDTGGFRFPIVADLSFAAFGKLADPKVGRIPAVVEVLPP